MDRCGTFGSHILVAGKFLTVHRQQLQQQKEQHGENIGVTNKKGCL